MTGSRQTGPATKAKELTQPYGVGYLYHYDPGYQAFERALRGAGGVVDIYEVLGVQFNSEPEALERFAATLGKPITLHSFEYCLGNVQRPPQAVLERVLRAAKLCNAAYIGEHMAFMGDNRTYAGGFITPPGTDEQNEILVQHVQTLKSESPCPIILENPSKLYPQIGPYTIGQQLRKVAEAADVGILLSLSNISISERFVPQDREEILAALPLERVKQLHLICGNEAEERMPGMEGQRQEQAWMLKTMEQLARNPDFKPVAVIYELQAGTPSLAEPERLRDHMELARELFFRPERRQAA